MRKAIIIGASSGIGYEVAKILIADGWQVAVCARRVELLRDLEKMGGGRVIRWYFDVTLPIDEDELFLLISKIGGLDLFFYSSGIGRQNYSLNDDIELSTVDTNCMGFCRTIGFAYRYMAAFGGGQIAAITSIAGTKGLGAAPAYSATKAFQSTYLEALSQQAHMRGLNITITDIRPGFVATALLGDDPYPMLMSPEKVARKIVKSVYHNRHVVVIDWRWRILTAAWSLIPSFVWRRLRIGFKSSRK